MSTHVIPTGTQTTVEANDRSTKARRAVVEFRKLLPTLTGYARALTGKRDVKVVISATSNGSTDGQKIMVKPPIALGEYTPHVRRLCEKRDENLQLLCGACSKREAVLIVIYHEIAHIAFKSFAEPDDMTLARITADAVRASGSRFAQSIQSKLDMRKIKSYGQIAQLISEWLPMVFNVLEDARVDTEMYDARPGTRVMYRSMLNRTRDDGIELPDGTTQAWSENPLNVQMIFGVYCIMVEYDYTGWFTPEVDRALKDKQLVDLATACRTAKSAAVTYRNSFAVLERLRELGYCKLPDEPDEPEQEPDTPESSDLGPAPEPDPEAEQNEEADSGAGQGEAEPDSQETESDDQGTGDDASSQTGGSSGTGEVPETDSNSADDSREESEQPEQEDSSGSSGVEEDTDVGADDAVEDQSASDIPSRDTEESSDDAQGEDQDRDTGSDEGTDSDFEDGDPSRHPDSSAYDDYEDDVWGNDESEDYRSGGISEGDDSGGSEAAPVEESRDLRNRIRLGTPGEAEDILKHGTGHDDADPHPESDVYRVGQISEAEQDSHAVEVAILQVDVFDAPSTEVSTLVVHEHENDDSNYRMGWSYKPVKAIKIDEAVLASGVMKARIAFSNNQHSKHQTDLTAGKVNARSLARRAPFGDDRLFHRVERPGKRNYEILMGVDISGSTMGRVLTRIRRAVAAQAEMCARIPGVSFAVYAHSGSFAGSSMLDGYQVDIYPVKQMREPWNDKAKDKLRHLQSTGGNLDGHTLEFYRKHIERSRATDKIILYYTDGAMPAANYDEELEILQRELAICKQKNIIVLGVGVGTDSPTDHGLETVRLDSEADLPSVVEHLGRRLR